MNTESALLYMIQKYLAFTENDTNEMNIDERESILQFTYSNAEKTVQLAKQFLLEENHDVKLFVHDLAMMLRDLFQQTFPLKDTSSPSQIRRMDKEEIEEVLNDFYEFVHENHNQDLTISFKDFRQWMDRVLKRINTSIDRKEKKLSQGVAYRQYQLGKLWKKRYNEGLFEKDVESHPMRSQYSFSDISRKSSMFDSIRKPKRLIEVSSRLNSSLGFREEKEDKYQSEDDLFSYGLRKY